MNNIDTMQVKEFDEINNLIRSKIVNMNANEQLNRLHTQMLINCSAGDKNAKEYVKQLIQKELLSLSYEADSIEELTNMIYSKNWGLGPLDKYDIDEIDEIMIQGTKIIIQKQGEFIEVPEKISDYNEAIAIIRRSLEFDKKQDINELNCISLVERMDGSRITAVIPPVAKMPYLNIRKFDSFLPTTANMINSKTINEKMAEMLQIFIEGRANIIVIGEMGAGKTTFLKWLLDFIPDSLNVGTLETTFELHLEKLYPKKKFIQLREHGSYQMQDLFAVMLRQNVDIMLVGESRSYEVNELIKAMSRGHSGSIGTAHSIGPEDVIEDFADMVLESGKSVNLESLKYRIARAVDIVIKFRKLPNRRRVCSGIYEIVADKNTLGYNAVPIVEFEIDEENNNDLGEHIFKYNVSDKLKNKLKEYGVSNSKINKVFLDELFLNSSDRE